MPMAVAGTSDPGVFLIGHFRPRSGKWEHRRACFYHPAECSIVRGPIAVAVDELGPRRPHVVIKSTLSSGSGRHLARRARICSPGFAAGCTESCNASVSRRASCRQREPNSAERPRTDVWSARQTSARGGQNTEASVSSCGADEPSAEGYILECPSARGQIVVSGTPG